MAVNFGNNALDDWLDLNRLENINAFFLDTIERGMLLRGPTPPPSKSECTVSPINFNNRFNKQQAF